MKLNSGISIIYKVIKLFLPEIIAIFVCIFLLRVKSCNWKYSVK